MVKNKKKGIACVEIDKIWRMDNISDYGQAHEIHKYPIMVKYTQLNKSDYGQVHCEIWRCIDSHCQTFSIIDPRLW